MKFKALILALCLFMTQTISAQTPLNNAEQPPTPPSQNPCSHFSDWNMRVTAIYGAVRSNTIVTSTYIPFREHEGYGYEYSITGITEPIEIKEVLIAPKPIPNWPKHKHKTTLTFSDDLTSATTVSKTKPGETSYGMMTYWQVATVDDPEGIYTAEIHINGKLACRGQFNLKKM